MGRGKATIVNLVKLPESIDRADREYKKNELAWECPEGFIHHWLILDGIQFCLYCGEQRDVPHYFEEG